MALRIAIKVQGDEAVRRKLKRLGDGINDMTDVMKGIGIDAIQYYSTTGFTDKGRPFGAAWPSYSVRYKKYKEKKYPGRPMLIASGKMQDGFFAKATRNSVIIDNKAPHYKYHQSSAARTKMPYRPMAGINGNIKDLVRERVQEDIRRKLRG